MSVMRYALGIAAIVAAIIFGPLITDAIRGDGKTDVERSMERLERAMKDLDEASR